MAKAVFAIPDMGAGGAERVISVLCREFESEAISTEILMLFGDRNYYHLPEQTRVRTLSLAELPIKERVKRLRRALKEIVGRDGGITVFAFQDSVLRHLLAAKVGLRGVRLVVSERSNPYVKGASLVARLKSTLPYMLADRAVFQTPDARRYYLLPDWKCKVIANPITPVETRWKRVDTPSFVSVCRLNKAKNIPMALDAMRLLRQRVTDATLDIYGDGELLEQIKGDVTRLGLQDIVTLKGKTKDVTGVIARYFGFLSSSDYEGISNSMLEAMSVGMPVICTDCPIGGAKMMLSDNCGLLTPVGDAEALAQAMAKVWENRNLADEISANALKKSEEYSPREIARLWMQTMK